MPASSTSGSFSMRCWPSRRNASSPLIPTGPVMRPSDVITSCTFVVAFSLSATKRMSRFEMMPTSLPASSTTGRPEMRNWPQISSTSATVASAEVVMGFVIMPDSDRFTRSTMSDWS